MGKKSTSVARKGRKAGGRLLLGLVLASIELKFEPVSAESSTGEREYWVCSAIKSEVIVKKKAHAP